VWGVAGPVCEAIKVMGEGEGAQAKKNRMDQETADFYNRVRDSYLGIAKREPERFRVVDATGGVSEIQGRVLEMVSSFLK